MTNNTPESTSARLDRIETLLADMADVVISNAETTDRHDTALTRIESALDRLTERVAVNNDRIEQILEYLFRERPNGRTGNKEG